MNIMEDGVQGQSPVSLSEAPWSSVQRFRRRRWPVNPSLASWRPPVSSWMLGWNISGYTLVVMDSLPSAMENTFPFRHVFSIGFTGLNGISCIFCHKWGICDSQLHKTIAGYGDIRHAWVMEKAPPSNPPEVVVLLRKSDRFQGQFRPTLVSNIFLHDHPDC